MTRRNTILLVAVAAVAAVGAYWMLALAPKREEAAAIDTKIAAKQAALAQAEAEVADYEQARARLPGQLLDGRPARQGRSRRRRRALADGADQLCRRPAAASTSARSTSARRALPAPAPLRRSRPPATKAPPPGASTVGTAGFATMPFSFGFKGSFFELGKFFNRLDRFVAVRNGGLDVTGRLLLLNSITLTPDTEKGFPMLIADVSASSYLLPRHRGSDGRRDRRQPDGQRHGSAWRQPGAECARDHHDRDDLWSHSMSVLNDTWRFLVQRRLLPVAILLIAAAAAVPMLLSSEPAPPPAAPGVRRQGRQAGGARHRPDRRPGRRWRPCRPPQGARLSQGPLQAEGHADSRAQAVRGEGAGHRDDRRADDRWRRPGPWAARPRRTRAPRSFPARRRRRRRRTSSTS